MKFNWTTVAQFYLFFLFDVAWLSLSSRLLNVSSGNLGSKQQGPLYPEPIQNLRDLTQDFAEASCWSVESRYSELNEDEEEQMVLRSQFHSCRDMKRTIWKGPSQKLQPTRSQ